VAAWPQPHQESSQQMEGREQESPIQMDGIDITQPFSNHQAMPQSVPPNNNIYNSPSNASIQQNLNIAQQQYPPKIRNATSSQIRDVIYETLQRETGLLSGWQAEVRIEERVVSILSL
jgi:hypothetical protein